MTFTHVVAALLTFCWLVYVLSCAGAASGGFAAWGWLLAGALVVCIFSAAWAFRRRRPSLSQTIASIAMLAVVGFQASGLQVPIYAQMFDELFRLSFMRSIVRFGLPVDRAWWFSGIHDRVGYYVFSEFLAASLTSLFRGRLSVEAAYYDVLPLLGKAALAGLFLDLARTLRGFTSTKSRGQILETLGVVVGFGVVAVGLIPSYTATLYSAHRQMGVGLLVALTIVVLCVKILGDAGYSRRKLQMHYAVLLALPAVLASTKLSLLFAIAPIVGFTFLNELGRRRISRTQVIVGAFAIAGLGWAVLRLSGMSSTPALQRPGLEFSPLGSLDLLIEKQILWLKQPPDLGLGFVALCGIAAPSIWFLWLLVRHSSPSVRVLGWSFVAAIASNLAIGLLFHIPDSGNAELYWLYGATILINITAAMGLVVATNRLGATSIVGLVAATLGMFYFGSAQRENIRQGIPRFGKELQETCQALANLVAGDATLAGYVLAHPLGFGSREGWIVNSLCAFPTIAVPFSLSDSFGSTIYNHPGADAAQALMQRLATGREIAWDLAELKSGTRAPGLFVVRMTDNPLEKYREVFRSPTFVVYAVALE